MARPRRYRRPRCQARTHAGDPCRLSAVPGKRVCRYHGGLSTGWRGPRDMTAARAGRIRWLAARDEAKAAGLPVPRLGRIPRRRKYEPIEISRARAMVRDEIKSSL